MAETELSTSRSLATSTGNHVTVEAVRGRSRLTANRFEEPLRILNPQNSGDFVQLYLSSYGGGFVQGDRIDLTIEANPESAAFIGTQANTRVYSPDGARTCGQILRGTLAEKARLIMWPDPLVLHADSVFDQQQEWHMSSSSELTLLDIIAPGRMNNGELFAFDRLTTRVTITVDGQPFITDHYRFHPESDSPLDPAQYAQYRFLLALYLIGPGVARHEDELADRLTADGFMTDAQHHSGQALTSLVALRDNALILRSMLSDSRQVDRIRQSLTDVLTSTGISGNMTWGRKY